MTCGHDLFPLPLREGRSAHYCPACDIVYACDGGVSVPDVCPTSRDLAHLCWRLLTGRTRGGCAPFDPPMEGGHD